MGFLDAPESAFLVFTALHFTIGRTASVVFAIINSLPLAIYLPLALFYDLVQIPLYGFVLEGSSRVHWLRRLGGWVKGKGVSWQQRKLVQRISSLGDVGVVLLCALPIRGFGVLSATIFSYLILGRQRVKGTLLLMAGSILGIILTVALTEGVLSLW